MEYKIERLKKVLSISNALPKENITKILQSEKTKQVNNKRRFYPYPLYWSAWGKKLVFRDNIHELEACLQDKSGS